ncbi:FAD/NAD(P)-binding domain-containing protein [Xylariaceae sp. FL0662B]|nr:FAD/NAD(P)-binding domain-containing protein [Xylariaceae sp. FL0662B]
MGSSPPVRLQVGIVGCGIAGLSAAIGLSRAGHAVQIFEQSKFKSEVGAAMICAPNATRILSRWGFDFNEAGAVDCHQLRRVKADTLEVDSTDDFTHIQQKYGDRWLFFHRADLHSGLQRLATSSQAAVSMYMGNKVVDIDVFTGTIKLSNGEEVQKDLVIIADGAHSELNAKVVGRPCPAMKTPMSIYRILQPFDRILQDAAIAKLYRDQPSGLTTFYKADVGRPGLLLTTYPCRNRELLYVALMHPTKPKEQDIDSWDAPAAIEDMMADADGFHPAVKVLFQGATDVRVYTQMWQRPLERYTRGRAVVIGDAAHLMLPTHAQGASMAVEDAMALQVLFENVGSLAEVTSRLGFYDRLRLPRARTVQTLSNGMMGPPEIMEAEVRRYYDGPLPGSGAKAKTYSAEYNDFFFLYDVAEEARKLLGDGV